MKAPLKILHLEDHPDDTLLVQSALKAAGIVCATTWVQSRAEFLAALEGGANDLVLSDHSLPGFDGMAATEMVRAQWPEIPVILVSGTMGEEQAVDSLKNGATDYVLKDRLFRLAPAVRRAMRDVEFSAERRRLQAQFIEAQKMEVIGQLAAGIAHDFNNLLSVITGNLDLMSFGLAKDSPVREFAGEIRHASDRAAGLTRQLLVFSRKQIVHPVVLDLNVVVENLDKMLRRIIGETIVMTMVPGSQIGRIKADAGYVGQVVLNLVVNARDAMPNGGRLAIGTENVELEENAPHTNPAAVPGRYVVLTVTDTGHGMTDEVKRRLFEPFFTTKPPGKGTGLGLATSHTIVQQSGGYIEIESAVGHGSTFKVFFPRVADSLPVAVPPTATGPLPRGTETLLIVEDEQSLRKMASRILQAQGYEVLLAANGLEALQVVNQHAGAPVQLVVTDVVMPQMGGMAMAEWLKATDPGLKILFTSGYTDEAVARHGVLDAGTAFLPKPYTPAILANKVRAMLDGQGGTEIFRKRAAPNPQPNPLP